MRSVGLGGFVNFEKGRRPPARSCASCPPRKPSASLCALPRRSPSRPMGGCIKVLGDRVPLGEVVFFDSAMILMPPVLFLVWLADFPGGLSVASPARSSALAPGSTSFTTIWLLPLAEATLLSWLAPVMLTLPGCGRQRRRWSGESAASRWGSLEERPSAFRRFRAPSVWGVSRSRPEARGGIPDGGSADPSLPPNAARRQGGRHRLLIRGPVDGRRADDAPAG